MRKNQTELEDKIDQLRAEISRAEAEVPEGYNGSLQCVIFDMGQTIGMLRADLSRICQKCSTKLGYNNSDVVESWPPRPRDECVICRRVIGESNAYSLSPTVCSERCWKRLR